MGLQTEDLVHVQLYRTLAVKQHTEHSVIHSLKSIRTNIFAERIFENMYSTTNCIFRLFEHSVQRCKLCNLHTITLRTCTSHPVGVMNSTCGKWIYMLWVVRRLQYMYMHVGIHECDLVQVTNFVTIKFRWTREWLGFRLSVAFFRQHR